MSAEQSFIHQVFSLGTKLLHRSLSLHIPQNELRFFTNLPFLGSLSCSTPNYIKQVRDGASECVPSSKAHFLLDIPSSLLLSKCISLFHYTFTLIFFPWSHYNKLFTCFSASISIYFNQFSKEQSVTSFFLTWNFSMSLFLTRKCKDPLLQLCPGCTVSSTYTWNYSHRHPKFSRFQVLHLLVFGCFYQSWTPVIVTFIIPGQTKVAFPLWICP